MIVCCQAPKMTKKQHKSSSHDYKAIVWLQKKHVLWTAVNGAFLSLLQLDRTICFHIIQHSGHSVSDLLLCSSEERKSCRVGTTWGRVNDDRMFISGWTIHLTEQSWRSWIRAAGVRLQSLVSISAQSQSDRRTLICSSSEHTLHFHITHTHTRDFCRSDSHQYVCVCAEENKVWKRFLL